MKGLLPEKILFRKKSPYPKTYNPVYEKILKERVLEIISNNNSPIMPIIDKTKISEIYMWRIKLWQTLVWTINGRTSNASLYNTSKLLAKKI